MPQEPHGPDHYIPDEERTYGPDEENDRGASAVEPDLETPPEDAAEQNQAVDIDEDDDGYR